MGAKETKQLRRDFENLKRNDPTLRSLNYDNIELGNEGCRLLARAVKTNTILRRLQLGHCNIGPEGLHDLVRSLCEDRLMSSRLRKLELSTSSSQVPQGNPIGDEGAKSLAFLLASSVSLHHLRVSACSIGDSGAISIARALSQNDSLKTLDLSYNSISDGGAEELGEALKSNSTLKGLLLWSNRVFHTGAEFLASGLAANSTLQWLGLGCNHIGDEGVKAIALALLSNAQASNLTWLALGGNGITDKGVEHIAVSLKVQHAPQATGLASQLVDDRAAETSSLSEQIRLGKLRPMLDLGVTPSLVSLHGGGGEDDVDGGEVDKDEDGEEEDTGGVRSYCIPLLSLGLGGNKITCLGAGYLADGLKTNTNLLSLGLADNQINNDGASSFAELIRRTDTLQKITLSGNNIEDEGGSILMASLSQNTSLRGLYLAGNPCGDGVGERCQEVIGRHNHTLQTLDLHDTRMTTPAVSDLLSTMRTEKVLHSLGSQPLPLPGAKGHAPIPLTGNMLEMEEWKPQSMHTILLQKKGKKLPSIAPSQRLNTLDALGSLPEPEETAQTMVVRQSQQTGRGTHKRRGSISQYIKRKLSKKKDNPGTATTTSYNFSSSSNVAPVSGSNRKARNSRVIPPGIELQPLVEEDSPDDGGTHELQGEDEVDGTRDFFRSPTIMIESTEEAREEEISSSHFRTPGGASTTNEALADITPFVTTSGFPVDSSDDEGAVSTSNSALRTNDATTIDLIATSTPAKPKITSPSSNKNSVTTTTSSIAPFSQVTSKSGTTTTTASISNTATSVTTASGQRGTTTAAPVSNKDTPVTTASGRRGTTTAAPVSNKATSVTAASTAASVRSTSASVTRATTTTTKAASISKTITSSSVTTGTRGAITTKTTTSSTSLTSGTSGTSSTAKAGPSITSTRGKTKAAAVPATINERDGGAADHVDLDAIPRTPSLDNLTRDRPKPPSQRRPPSRFRTPSPSPTHVHTGHRNNSSSSSSSKPEIEAQVERIGGITSNGVNQKVDTSSGNSNYKPEVPIKDQWCTALQKRVGVLKMGGFLHRAFDTIASSNIGSQHSFTAARMLFNDPKNRLVAPLPPSHTRVKLQLVPDELGSDYINANFVGPPTQPKKFIAAQAPIPSTIGDFWRMIWENRVGVVVVLTREDEVDSWWPEEGEQQSQSLVVDGDWIDNSLIVSSVSEQVNSANPDLMVHSLNMESLTDDETDSLKIFHYTEWAQYGIIEKTKDASGLVRHVLRAKFAQQFSNAPVVVVSKLGAGRAGCFCALSLAYELMTSSGEPHLPEEWKQNINILDQIVQGLRDCRGGLVSSQKQFEFCHQALEEVMWGRPASQEELDTWEALAKRKGKKGKKKWRGFGKKDKTNDKGMKRKKGTNVAPPSDFSRDSNMNTTLLF